MAKVGVKIKIIGQVQGVNFRYELYQFARQTGLTGWVKNTADGGVECLAEGEEEKLKELVKWCEKGPRLAAVEKVEVGWQEAEHNFKEFEITYDL